MQRKETKKLERSSVYSLFDDTQQPAVFSFLLLLLLFPIHNANWNTTGKKNDNNHFWLLTCAPNRTIVRKKEREKKRRDTRRKKKLYTHEYVHIEKKKCGNGRDRDRHIQVNGIEFDRAPHVKQRKICHARNCAYESAFFYVSALFLFQRTLLHTHTADTTHGRQRSSTIGTYHGYKCISHSRSRTHGSNGKTSIFCQEF